MLSFTTTLSTLLLQFFLFSLAAADEFTTQDNAWKWGSGGGVLGFIILILDVIAIIEIIKSGRPPVNKLLWALLVFFFPIVGLILYYLLANRSAGAGSYEPIA